MANHLLKKPARVEHKRPSRTLTLTAWAVVTVASVLALPAHSAEPDAQPSATPAATTPSSLLTSGAIDGALVQVFNGMFLGIVICEADFGCFGDVETTAVAAGAAAGAITGFVAGSYFEPGDVMMVNSGMITGLAAGLITAQARIDDMQANNEEGDDKQLVFIRHIVIGELLGGAAFGALAAWRRPSAAQVSLANSGALWTSFLLSMREQTRGRTVSRTGMMATITAGFAGGWLLWDELHLSRLSVWKLDVGAILGALGGALWAAQTKTNNDAEIADNVMVGTLIGLAGAAWVVADDTRDGSAGPAVSLGIAPRRDGGLLTLRGAF